MIHLLQVNLQNLNQVSGGDGSFLNDVIVAILGGLLGTGTALLVFYLTNRHQIKQDNKKKREIQKNKLYYFASVLNSSIAILKLQKDHVKKFIYSLKKDTLFLPDMSFTPMTDVKRILESMNLEDYFLSYSNQYGTKIKTVKEYKGIIDTLEFLYSSFNSVVVQLEKAQRFDHERKLNFQNKYQEAYNIFGELLFNIQHTPIPISPEIETIYADFMDNLADQYDLKYYHDTFLVPLHNLFTPYILNTQNPRADEIKLLAVKLKELRSLYEYMKSNNLVLANDYLQQVRSISPQCRKLEQLSKPIIHDFYSDNNDNTMASSNKKNFLKSGTFWSVLISVAALVISWLTYNATVRQLSLSAGQVRAYVQVVDAKLIHSINDASFIQLKLTVKNFGQTGAINMEGDMDYQLGMPGDGTPNNATKRNLGSMAPGIERTFILTSNRINKRDWPKPSTRTQPLYFFGTIWYTDATTNERKKDDYCYELSFQPADSTFNNLELQQAVNFSYNSVSNDQYKK